jgi:wyosine [tRNA(Phe)-imidazoG37] synthetase (radical SAM superfamily)
VIVLTGSALIPRADVRRDLAAFDTVVAALDAPDEQLFQRINRPGTGYPYSFAAIVEGLRRFRRAYTGHLVLQMMFLQANQRAAPQMADLARSIEPDEVQLNTPLQPALGGPVSAEDMRQVARAFVGLHLTSVYDGGKARVRPRIM